MREEQVRQDELLREAKLEEYANQCGRGVPTAEIVLGSPTSAQMRQPVPPLLAKVKDKPARKVSLQFEKLMDCSM